MRHFIVLAALAASGTALAQDTTTTTIVVDDDQGMMRAGGAVTAGGGATVANDDWGGMWQVRGIIGTRTTVGGELAYVGTARDIPNSDNTAISNGGEAALRVSAPFGGAEPGDGLVAPFLYGGIGYSWNEIAREGDNIRDNGAYVPIGVGLGFGGSGFYGDARVSWREPLTDDLPGEAGDGSLILSGNLGAEF